MRAYFQMNELGLETEYRTQSSNIQIGMINVLIAS